MDNAFDLEMARVSASTADQGLSALVTLLRFHGIGIDREQLCHRFGNVIGVPEMLRCAKELGLRAKCFRTTWTRLPKMPLPGLAVLRHGGFLLLGKVGDGKAIVQRPLESRPVLMTRGELEAEW